MTTTNPTVHPWNSGQAEALVRSSDRLAHAILLAGPAGLGKNTFAEWLCRFLLCQQPQENGEACGHCHGCQLLQAGSHADLHVVQPESLYKHSDSLLARYALRYPPEDKSKDAKDSTAIRIDQIRSLIQSCQSRPHTAGRRVMVLTPADRMNINAANALLKLLEEPPPESIILLVTDRPSRLPATIRSRCLCIDFHLPIVPATTEWLIEQGVPATTAPEYLALAGGAPLAALDYWRNGFIDEREQLIGDLEGLLTGKTDPVSCAVRWKERGTERCLLWLQGWLADLMRADSAGLHNPGAGPRLQALQKRLHLKQLFPLADAVGRNRNRVGGSLDEQLLLEDTLIRWTELQTSPNP